MSNQVFEKVMKYLEINKENLKYQHSELSDILPYKLKLEIVKTTHKDVFNKLRFFQNRSDQFNSQIVTELKPLVRSQDDIIYMQNEEAEDIYFIVSGQVKHFIDMNMLIYDEELDDLI